MGIISQVLSGDFDDTEPLIGYDNVVTTANITSTTEDADFPVSNLANPATHLMWVGTTSIDGGTLLHFELSGDSPDIVTDSSTFAHTWTPVGNVFMDTAQFKFGSRSARFDGTTDAIEGDGNGGMAFGSNDFTIDFWLRMNTVGTHQRLIDSRPDGTTNGSNISLEKPAANTLLLFVTGATRITGTTALTTGQWYHVALTRSGTNTRLFLNGTQEGATWTTDSTVYTVGQVGSRPRIGARGDVTSPGESLDGWIDDFRVVNGEALWTANFTAPSDASDSLQNEYLTVTPGGTDVDYIGIAKHNFGTSGALVSVEMADTSSPGTWTELIAPQTVDDDLPIIFRFQDVTTQVRVRIQPAGTAPEAAVLYAGELLVLERSITIGRGHVPVTYGRRTNIVNGMSETGNFLGRIVLGEYRQSKAEFEWFTSDFYRIDIDPFLDAAQEIPFFWAWSPSEYPTETGYVWLTNNAEPEVDPATRRVALTLEMRGIA